MYEGIKNITSKAYIIGEVGTNHGGDLEKALAYVNLCAEAGCQAVKFQSWHVDKFQSIYDLVDGKAKKTGNTRRLLQRYEFPKSWYAPLMKACEKSEIDFLSTPFDNLAVDEMYEAGVRVFKVSSSDLTNGPLLDYVAQKNCPIILSTGMGNMEEISSALDHIYRYHRQVILLHCTAAYPPVDSEANLTAISTMRSSFGHTLGYSDHYLGVESGVIAATLGARVFERHVVFDKNDGHPDSSFATTPSELEAYVRSVQRTIVMLGNGEKTAQQSELNSQVGGRKGLFANKKITVGQVIKREDIELMRPQIGDFVPNDLASLLGKACIKTIEAGDPFYQENIK